MDKYLSIKWTRSRAAETAGYNRVTLTDERTGEKFSTVGGGYDMTGTVFAQWLAANYQPQLLALVPRAGASWAPDGGYQDHRDEGRDRLYGMTYYRHENRVVLDGACGLESIKRIAEAIGLDVRETWINLRRGGERTGFIVTDRANVERTEGAAA